jgi:hypothetical protein
VPLPIVSDQSFDNGTNSDANADAGHAHNADGPRFLSCR